MIPADRLGDPFKRPDDDDIILIGADQRRMGREDRQDRRRLQEGRHLLGIALHFGIGRMHLDEGAFGVDSQDHPPFRIAQDGEGVDPAIERPLAVNFAILSLRIEVRTDAPLAVVLKLDLGPGRGGVKEARLLGPQPRDFFPCEEGGEKAGLLRKAAANVAGETEGRRDDLLEGTIFFDEEIFFHG